MSIRQRVRELEAISAEPVTIRVLWPNDDGTYTDDRTGEVMSELGEDVIELRWEDENE